MKKLLCLLYLLLFVVGCAAPVKITGKVKEVRYWYSSWTGYWTTDIKFEDGRKFENLQGLIDAKAGESWEIEIDVNSNRQNRIVSATKINPRTVYCDEDGFPISMTPPEKKK